VQNHVWNAVLDLVTPSTIVANQLTGLNVNLRKDSKYEESFQSKEKQQTTAFKITPRKTPLIRRELFDNKTEHCLCKWELPPSMPYVAS
jgi:hypothetical protein